MVCDWIAVDWGTSRVRAWSMVNNAPTGAVASDDGMGNLTKAQFEPALLSLIHPWLGVSPIEVIACGMVGARQGWEEAPYLAAPCAPTGSELTRAPTNDARINVHIVNGLKQESPADVMRGEETQIAGFLRQDPDFDGVLCLPGTHTKWVHISAGEVVSFRTFMTGEMFALLAKKSVLRHTVADASNAGNQAHEQASFAEALGDAMAKPEAIAARLFALRAEDLLRGSNPNQMQARLSGYLIGMELAAARPYWLGRDIALIGSPSLTANYSFALLSQGIKTRDFEGDAMSLEGLIATYQRRKTSQQVMA